MYSRNNLPKTIKKGAYVINLDEYKNIGTHWVALFIKPKYVVYFDSFGIEHFPTGIEHAIGNKEIKANIFRTQAYIQLCVVIFVLSLLTICLMVKV